MSISNAVLLNSSSKISSRIFFAQNRSNVHENLRKMIGFFFRILSHPSVNIGAIINHIEMKIRPASSSDCTDSCIYRIYRMNQALVNSEIIGRPCQRTKSFKTDNFHVLCQNARATSAELNWTKIAKMMLD